jgi:hypothetical protein
MKARLVIAASAVLLVAASPPLTFVPVQPDFAVAAEEYRQLWCDEGARIVQALEEASGQPFPATPIVVFVANATPMTAYDGRTIWLKASYPAYYKRATLVHELGHRLSFTMARTPDLDDHRCSTCSSTKHGRGSTGPPLRTGWRRRNAASPDATIMRALGLGAGDDARTAARAPGAAENDRPGGLPQILRRAAGGLRLISSNWRWIRTRLPAAP